jgi:hypothetical protein
MKQKFTKRFAVALVHFAMTAAWQRLVYIAFAPIAIPRWLSKGEMKAVFKHLKI